MKQLGFVFIIIGLILPLIQCTPKKEAAKKSIFDYTTEELDQMSDSAILQLLKGDSISKKEYKRDTSIRLLLYPKKVIVENMEEEFYLFREIKNTGNKKQKFLFSGFFTCILQNNNESHSYPRWFSVKEKGIKCAFAHFINELEKLTLKANEAQIKKIAFRLDSFCWGEWNENLKIDSTGNFNLYTYFHRHGVEYRSDTITIEIKKKDSSN